MTHLPHLITDLGLLLGAAGISTLIFKRLSQPLVLGYLIAGLLVGPHFTFLPTIVERENIQIWAEIGVIFLLFSLGLEFSFKKLVKVGGASSTMALVEVGVMLLGGYLTGRLLGWSTMDSVFLGGILSISSTTIIIRAFDELGVKSQRFAGLVFGVLIVEDLVAILLLVLLSTLAVSQQFAGMEMLESILKLAFFLLVWFVGGIFLIPTFLKKASRYLNSEMLLILSIALCLMMVILAAQAGFSPALGAFIMGSILAETTQAEKIEHLLAPVKDLFGAVFFVSVGILIDPTMMVTYAGPIIVITLVTVVGKLFSITAGGLLAGQGLKTSIQAGMSVSQIGEFSFIIATLGLTLKVTSDFLYPIAVAVSAVTTFTTPYMIRFSEPLYHQLEMRLPARWKRVLEAYSTSTRTISSTSDWQLVLRAYVRHTVVLSAIMIAVVLLAEHYLYPFISRHLATRDWAAAETTALTFLVLAPFLWALAVHHPQKEALARLWAHRSYRSLILVMEFVRIILAVLFIGFLLHQFFTPATALWVGSGMVGLLALFSSRIQRFYIRIENRFLSNLNERERLEAQKMYRNIAPWDAHLTYVEIPPETQLAGQTLLELGIREQFGVNIAVIERGELTIMPPTQRERLFPGDRIYVFGNDEQISQFRQWIHAGKRVSDSEVFAKESVRLQRVEIPPFSPLIEQTIRNSGIREKTKGLIVGLESGGKRILNPESQRKLQEGDVLWIVGVPSLIKRLSPVGSPSQEDMTRSPA